MPLIEELFGIECPTRKGAVRGELLRRQMDNVHGAKYGDGSGWAETPAKVGQKSFLRTVF